MRKDADKLLLDLSVQAIQAAGGGAGNAKVGLSKTIREKRDLELERVLYAPYHNAAVDGAIAAGYKELRASGKYTIPKGTKPKHTSCFPDRGGFDETSTFPMAADGAEPDASDDPMRFGGGGHVDVGLGLHDAPDKPWRPHLDADSLRDEKKVLLSCALDILLINGKPARWCTGRELREFADHSNNQARFAAMLANGLTDEMVAGDCWTEAEANAFYVEAGFKLPRG